jgi:sugar lactone lactonase YvrE
VSSARPTVKEKLKIDPIRDLFENKNPKGDHVSIWKTLLLKNDDFSPQERISDIFYHNSVLYVTGTSETETTGQRSGSLWQMDQGTGELTRMATFKGYRPEGIASGKDEKTLLLSFDQGKGNPSQTASVRVGL